MDYEKQSFERFELGDGSPEEKYAEYQSNPEWRRIYRFLHPGYWHVTDPAAWIAIHESGAIKPNVGGRFETPYQRSYAFVNECVALFDFAGPTEEEVIQVWGRACDVLTMGALTGDPSVLLRLDRRRLRPKIIPNSEGWPPKESLLSIPYIEVWYPGEIPIAAITGRFRLRAVHGLRQFRPERFDEARNITDATEAVTRRKEREAEAQRLTMEAAARPRVVARDWIKERLEREKSGEF
jgi:hypothetical protein